MNYLHIAIIEDSGECLVSYTELGLREQVVGSLALRGVDGLTDEEWADCVKGEISCDRATDCLPFGTIYYYKTVSRLDEHVNGVGAGNKPLVQKP